ncbi:MAG: SPASM domain-containing protein, partial [Promethearchaeota archaeon]
GNVNDHDFMELWTSQKYQKMVLNWGNNETCKTCNMRKPKENIHW